MASIYIETKPVDLGMQTIFDHLYLVYQDDLGNEYVLRGGPLGDGLGNFGVMSIELGVPISQSEDYRPIEDRAAHGSQQLNLGDRDAAAVWETLLNHANTVASAALPYEFTAQNSNSFVASLLHVVGLNIGNNLPDAAGYDWTPGIGNILDSIKFDLYGGTGTFSEHDDVLWGGQSDDRIQGYGGRDILRGNAGDDILVGNKDAPANLTALDLTTENAGWDDNATDRMYGGDGSDTYLIHSNRRHIQDPWKSPELERMITDEIDYIDGTDQDFTAYYQFSWDDTVYKITLTSSILANGIPHYNGAETTYEFSSSVTYDRDNGEEISFNLMGDLRGNNLILRVSYENAEMGYLLGGVLNFLGDAPGTPGTPGGPTGPSAPSESGALGVDDILTASIDGSININPMANDQIPDGIQVHATVWQPALRGELEQHSSGFTYTPYLGYSGVDMFQYRLVDNQGNVLTPDGATSFIIVGEISQVVGTSGNDTLSGSQGDDALFGKGGDDVLNGGAGNDTYVYSLGGGDDVINDWGDAASFDVLMLGYGLSTEYTLVERGDDDFWDMKLSFDTGGSVTIKGGFLMDGSAIENIRFADGRSYSSSSLMDVYLTQLTTSGNDIIHGFMDRSDLVFGARGNDEIHGYSGDDILYGEAGNDTLFGEDGSDILVGGAGDDFMIGGSGSDTFVFASGEAGEDWIDDFEVGEDIIDLYDVQAFGDFQDVLDASEEWDGTTWLTISETNSIRLQNVTLASLSASDFIFA